MTNTDGLSDDQHITTDAVTIETIRNTYLVLPGDSGRVSGVEMMEKLDDALERIFPGHARGVLSPHLGHMCALGSYLSRETRISGEAVTAVANQPEKRGGTFAAI